ncbi:hypothetical protein IHE45_05G178800 [Dioscorea alata]|uniref:Uncharacterized protein n=2 Tax=Dioscorea alata TaxID=55571 RepID=A0ACB7W7H5_DIOAL|nr:hypothetical protein IHE45_05G178800 [Dioscorea alata]KAH7683382.1 hypothetical protein IHE45_05G178800 [Dioscorea alata]
MPRHSKSSDVFIDGACKIRKRGCSSSSSASSVLQNYKFKKAILIPKRNVGSPPSSKKASFFESSPNQPLNIVGIGAQQGSVSARKLASALWETNKIPSSQRIVDIPGKINKKEIKGRGRIVKSVLPDYLPPHLSDPSHSPVSVISGRSRSHSLRKMMQVVPWRSRHNDRNSRASDFVTDVAEKEIKTCTQGFTLRSKIGRNKELLKDLTSGFTSCKELLRTLNHICMHEEQRSSSIPLVSALRHELDRVQILVDQLIEEQRLSCDEITHLKKSYVVEKSAWKSKEQEMIRAVLNSITETFESEKRQRRRSEKLNNKLGMELAKTKSTLLKAIKELDNERRTRELIEQFCSDLVRGIGQDKAEVEEMKLESAKLLEELEKEREMLQLADGWREERIQMKLSEAKFQFEEKNAAVDQLRNELEAFLHDKTTKDPMATDLKTDERVAGKLQYRQEHDEDEKNDINSTDGDFHSIELNMDSVNKSYRWSHATDTVNDASKKGLVGNLEKTSRRSFSPDGVMAERWYLNLGCQLHQGRQSRKKTLELNVDMESPKWQWSKPQDLQDMDDEVGAKGSMHFELVKSIRDECSNS